jgi:hypothetical protein
MYALDAAARFNDAQPMSGFVVAGELVISGGELTWSLDCVPGDPQYVGGAPGPITVGQVDAASYQAHPAGDIDPRIRITDLAYASA